MGPGDFVPIDGIMWEEPPPGTLSETWFAVADDAIGNFVSIDLAIIH